jgi:hypothetical protein
MIEAKNVKVVSAQNAIATKRRVVIAFSEEGESAE